VELLNFDEFMIALALSSALPERRTLGDLRRRLGCQRRQDGPVRVV